MTRQNGQTHGKVDKESDPRPGSTVEVYSEATSPTAEDDDFLSANNLGLGNYSKKEYYQQVDSFRKGQFADAAFGRRIVRLGKRQTQLAMARDKWDTLSDEERAAVDSKREWLHERGQELWNALDERERWARFAAETNISKNWTPPFWRMMMMRHEGSRSISARLLDNLFGRIKKKEHVVEQESSGSGLFSRSKNGRDKR